VLKQSVRLHIARGTWRW